MNENKFEIQEKQYENPRHHFLEWNDGDFKLYKILSWGLDYYAYANEIIELIIGFQSKKIADVGCGDGKLLYELSKRLKSSQLDGYDLAKKAILFAKAYAEDIENLNFYFEDFKNSKEEYNIIVCMEVLEHIPDNSINEFISNLNEKLNENGKLVISVPSNNIPLHIKHYRHYSEELLRKQLSQYFKIDKILFITKKGFLYKIINLFLINPLFILNNKFLRKILLKIFKATCVYTKPDKCVHILAVCSKK